MRGLLLAGALALPASVFAHPAQSQGLHRYTVDPNAFRLKSLAKYVNATETVIDAPSSFAPFAQQSSVEAATQHVKMTVPDAAFCLVDDHYVGDNGVAHVHFRQTANGLDIDNADFNVNVGKDGKVFSYGNSFYTGEIPSSASLTKLDFSDPVTALKGTTNTLHLPISVDGTSSEGTDENESYVFKGVSGTVSDPKAKLVYFVQADGSLALAWRVETDIDSNWLLTYIDAKSGEGIHGVVDYVAEAE